MFVRNGCYVLPTLKYIGSIIPESKWFNLNQHSSGPVPADFSMLIARSWFNCILYPAPPKGEGGILGSPWHLSVRPSGCRQGFCNFKKKTKKKPTYSLNAFHTWHLVLWGNLWTPIHSPHRKGTCRVLPAEFLPAEFLCMTSPVSTRPSYSQDQNQDQDQDAGPDFGHRWRTVKVANIEKNIKTSIGY